jgi:amino acid transporter
MFSLCITGFIIVLLILIRYADKVKPGEPGFAGLVGLVGLLVGLAGTGFVMEYCLCSLSHVNLVTRL